MILDAQVPTANPEELIVQLTPLLYKIAKRFTSLLEKHPSIDLDDLLQAGRIVIYNAQKRYDPSGGASFISYVFRGINEGMLRTIGMNPHTRELPPILESVDEPLSEESDETRLDFIPDNTPTAEERIVEQDGHQETADAVRAAVDRLKNAKQREVITRCWLNEQPKPEAAAEMGIKIEALRTVDMAARHKLRRDKQLQAYAMPFFHVGPKRFNTTWTSAVEAAVIWMEMQKQRERAAHDQDAV